MHNILITTIGTGAGINILRALRMQKSYPLCFWGADADPTAAGLRLVDKAIVTPRVSDPRFLESILEISKRCQGERLYLFPTYSKEIEFFAHHQTLLNENGIATILPQEGTVRLCNHKGEFGAFARNIGLRVPEEYSTEGAAKLTFPLFMKPFVGSGATGAIKIENEQGWLCHSHKNMIVQEFIDGQEITIDVFFDRTSVVRAVSARERISVKNGQSVKARTIDSRPFERAIERLGLALGLVGPTNFQFILDSKKENEPVLIEVNPRYASGGLMLSVEAGVSLPLLALEAMMDHDFSEKLIRAQEGIFMARYWSEVFWSEVHS